MTFSDWLFDVYWWVPAGIAVIGLAIAFQGNKRQAWTTRKWGARIILFAAAWALLSILVDTDKEKAQKGTRRIVAAVVDDHWEQFQAYLTPKALFSAGSHSLITGAENITSYARENAAAIRIKSALVHDMTVEQTGPLITTRFEIFSQQDAIAPTGVSTWQFDWEKTSDGWKIRELHLISLQNVSSDDLIRAIPRPERR